MAASWVVTSPHVVVDAGCSLGVSREAAPPAIEGNSCSWGSCSSGDHRWQLHLAQLQNCCSSSIHGVAVPHLVSGGSSSLGVVTECLLLMWSWAVAGCMATGVGMVARTAT